MKFRMRRIAEASAGIVLLVVAVSWLSGGCEQKIPAGRVSLSGVEASTPGERVPVRESVGPSNEWASGEIASARRTAVSARVVARIEEIRVTAGSRVEPGDVLIVLDARDLEARVGAAEETLRSEQARLELAESEYARTRALLAQGVVSKRQLDQASSELQSARAAVKSLEEGRQESRTTLSFAEIRAPVGGRVIDRLAEPGDTAMPGEPLLRIYDPGLLRVEVPVRESLAVHLRVGQTLEVEIPAVGSALQGVVDEIVPFAEPGARTLLVRVRLATSGERVFAGMFARVSIPAGERRMLLVPAAAVEEIGQLSYVDVVADDGTLQRRVVTTGQEHAAGQLEILSGLQPSDAVWLPQASDSSAAARARASAAVGAFRTALGDALRTALQQSPIAAIDVCRVQAPLIAKQAASDGILVGRTSHRLRNPDNAPEDWMLPVLEEFESAEPQPGSVRTVDLGERGTGYLEPIYVQDLCTTCHGTDVDPALLKHIRERYPDDRAVGFESGDFRGLFWSIVPSGSGSG